MREGRKRILMILLAIFVAFTDLCAQNTKAQESRKAKLEKEIELINKQLKENSSKSTTALNQLTLVRKNISNRRALVQECDKEIALLNKQIEGKKAEIRQLESRMDTLSLYYERLVRNAYKNRDAKVWYMYILASENLGQAFRRMGYLKNLSSQMRVQADKIRQTKAEIEAENAKLIELRAESQSLRNQRQKDVDLLRKEESQSQNLVNQLKKDRRKYQNELASKKKQVESLNREIERIIREATKGSAKKSKTAEIDYKLDAEFAKNKGKLPWPADGPVVEKYGQHYHPVYKNVKLPFNNGVTMAVQKGTKVKAIFNGVVKQIVVMPGYNKCVLVQHGNYFTFYCKLASVEVKAGDKITTGQTIGTVDTMDGSTQLHFQVWKGTTPQNPESWLR